MIYVQPESLLPTQVRGAPHIKSEWDGVVTDPQRSLQHTNLELSVTYGGGGWDRNTSGRITASFSVIISPFGINQVHGRIPCVRIHVGSALNHCSCLQDPCSTVTVMQSRHYSMLMA